MPKRSCGRLVHDAPALLPVLLLAVAVVVGCDDDWDGSDSPGSGAIFSREETVPASGTMTLVHNQNTTDVIVAFYMRDSGDPPGQWTPQNLLGMVLYITPDTVVAQNPNGSFAKEMKLVVYTR